MCVTPLKNQTHLANAKEIPKTGAPLLNLFEMSSSWAYPQVLKLGSVYGPSWISWSILMKKQVQISQILRWILWCCDPTFILRWMFFLKIGGCMWMLLFWFHSPKVFVGTVIKSSNLEVWTDKASIRNIWRPSPNKPQSFAPKTPAVFRKIGLPPPRRRSFWVWRAPWFLQAKILG